MGRSAPWKNGEASSRLHPPCHRPLPSLTFRLAATPLGGFASRQMAWDGGEGAAEHRQASLAAPDHAATPIGLNWCPPREHHVRSGVIRLLVRQRSRVGERGKPMGLAYNSAKPSIQATRTL